jgi:flagellar motility protein MotE (MotC chaperone)
MRLSRLAVLTLVAGLVALGTVATGPAPGQAPAPAGVAPLPLAQPPAASVPVTVYQADMFTAPTPFFQPSSEEQKLERQSHALARQYGQEEKREQREKLKDELSKVLSQQFDTQQQRRKDEIERIEAQLKKLRELMRKREDSKREIVNRRLDQMLQDAEGLGWTATGPGSATTPFGPAMTAPAAGLPLPSPRPR